MNEITICNMMYMYNYIVYTYIHTHTQANPLSAFKLTTNKTV